MATNEIEIREKRTNPVLIGVLIVVLLAALVLLFMFVIRPMVFTDQAAPEPDVEAPEIEEPAPETSPSPAAAPEETFEVFESKDPFRPLVVAGTAGGASGGATGGTSGGTSGGTTGGTTGGTSGGTTGGTSGGITTTTGSGAGGGAAPSGGERVTLMDVFTDNGQLKAQVKVNGTVYTVTEGQTFASVYKVVSLSGECGTFLRGDDRFTLCEGEEVIK